MVLFADWTSPVGAISSAVAAVAALIALVYAAQAAKAGRDAIREARDLHVEQDFRELGAGLWAVRAAAARALDQDPIVRANAPPLRNEQEKLQATFAMPRWADLGPNAPELMDRLLDVSSTPREVRRCASLLTAQLQHSWDRRVAERQSQNTPKARRPRWMRAPRP